MALGQSDRELFLATDIKSAFALCNAAGDKIGKVLESSALTSSMVVKTRYGLQSVKIRINLRPHDDGCMLLLQGASDDVWGGGARKAMDKFVAALEG